MAFELGWEEPHVSRFYQRLASQARLILFDARGTGMSDRVSISDLPDLETRMDDVRAVMDAAGSGELPCSESQRQARCPCCSRRRIRSARLH